MGWLIDNFILKLQENEIGSQLMWFDSSDVFLKDLSVRGTKLCSVGTERNGEAGALWASDFDLRSVWVVFPLCWWKTKPSSEYFSFDSTVKSSWIWIPQPSHQSWGAETWEVSLLGQILLFCSLQSPAEALLGSTARRKILRETLSSPLYCCCRRSRALWLLGEVIRC